MQRNKADCLSVQGFSHIRAGKECQDSSLCWQEKKYDGIIISDGHGGEKYIRSATGSRFACEVGKEILSSFMETLENKRDFRRAFYTQSREREKMLSQLERSLIQRWHERVAADLADHPLDTDDRYRALEDGDHAALVKSPVKAYGATFIAAVLTDSCFFVLKLGDGNACLLTRDLHAQLLNHLFPQLEDDELQFNLTTSLCNSDADVAFKHCFCRLNDRRAVQGLILTTDGIINSYQSEQAYLGFIENIFAGYREQQRKDAHAELAEFLPRLSEKGSGDDLSVAIICRKAK